MSNVSYVRYHTIWDIKLISNIEFTHLRYRTIGGIIQRGSALKLGTGRYQVNIICSVNVRCSVFITSILLLAYQVGIYVNSRHGWCFISGVPLNLFLFFLINLVSNTPVSNTQMFAAVIPCLPFAFLCIFTSFSCLPFSITCTLWPT